MLAKMRLCGLKYKLCKHQTTACVRSIFFCERVVNVWNSLPDDVSFDSFYRFRCGIMRINLSSHLRYCGRLSWLLFSFIYFMRAINIVKVNWGNYRCIFRTLLSCYTVILFVLSYMLELNKWRNGDDINVASMLKDYSRSPLVTHAVKVLISRKRYR